MSDVCAWCDKPFRLPADRVEVMDLQDPLLTETVHQRCYLKQLEESRLMGEKPLRQVPKFNEWHRPVLLDGT